MTRELEVGSQHHVQTTIVFGAYTSNVEICRGVFVVRPCQFRCEQLPPALKNLFVSKRVVSNFLEARRVKTHATTGTVQSIMRNVEDNS